MQQDYFEGSFLYLYLIYERDICIKQFIFEKSFFNLLK